VSKVIYVYLRDVDICRICGFVEWIRNLTILKRLGFILETTRLLDTYRDIFRKFIPSKGYPALDPLSPMRGKYNSRWGLLVNFELNPNGWIY